MKLPWAMATWAGTIKANVALSISNVVLAILLALFFVQSLSQKEDVVLVPPVVDKEMRISISSANKDYMESFGLYVATLVGNVTPTNATTITEYLSQNFDSETYASTRKTILAAAETSSFREAAASSKFEPENVHFEAPTSKVFVSGGMRLITTAGSQPPRPITYEMVIRIVNRRPVVYSLVSYDGAEPHTEQWLKDHPVNNQQKEEKQ